MSARVARAPRPPPEDAGPERKLRIALVHHFYGSSAPSGENAVVEAERDLLRARGHEVVTLFRHGDALRRRGALGLVQGALSSPWNPLAVLAVRRLLAAHRPDVLHVHNVFPSLSPAIFRAARGLSTATVLTLHNFRVFCAAGTLSRGAGPCRECLDRRSVVPALVHGCYRDSRPATVAPAAAIALHRALGTFQRDVDAFVALTAFARDLYAEGGLPPERLHVKPNFHPSPPEVVPWASRRGGAVFVGRLSREKGAGVLVDAWRLLGDAAPPLALAGDGPERAALAQRVAAAGLSGRVALLGALPPGDVARLVGQARLLVLPSICFEGLPLVVREAFAAGVPAAASRVGALPHVVSEGRTGLLFTAGDPRDLARAVREAFADDARLAAMGTAARAEFDARYTADRSYEALLAIYAAARARRAARA